MNLKKIKTDCNCRLPNSFSNLILVVCNVDIMLIVGIQICLTQGHPTAIFGKISVRKTI